MAALRASVCISIHPPREGWDLGRIRGEKVRTIFQSTHPVRGGTPALAHMGAGRVNFNPPTP